MSGIRAWIAAHVGRLARMGLPTQVAVFLTVAIAPIGAIAIAQAMFTAQEASKLETKALIDQTRLAADEERETITRAFGVAEGLSFVLPLEPERAAECSNLLTSLVSQNPSYVFAGVVTPDGWLHCASVPLTEPYDLRDNPRFHLLRSDDRPRAMVLPKGAISEQPVVAINHPVYRDGELVAYISLSLPISLLSTIAKATSDEAADYRLGLIDHEGHVFVEDADSGGDAKWTPVDEASDLVRGDPFGTRTFVAKSNAGISRTYVVTPVFRGDVFALGAWRNDRIGNSVTQRALLAALFPAAMLALALGVAYLAVHRLVLRHVFYLARIMRAFEGGRRTVRASGLRSASAELSALGDAFDRMAETIERDEKELAHSVEEKTILLKEVYHRVKNNLQLVISIMNMQIRAARSPGEREAIARLQDRVMGLASIHQRLYQASDLTAVRCDELLEEVAENLVRSISGEESSVALTVDSDPVVLGPDLAIPLALFATETITNALKHGAGASEGGWLRVTLRRVGESGDLRLTVTNRRAEAGRGDGFDTSIGGKLIRAFSAQLRGEMAVEEVGEAYEVTLTFPGEPDHAAVS